MYVPVFWEERYMYAIPKIETGKVGWKALQLGGGGGGQGRVLLSIPFRKKKCDGE